MKVLKFGGTSVGSAQGLGCIKNIVAKEKGALVVVVSALGGVTDQLILTANLALANDPGKDYKLELERIKERHLCAIEQSIDCLQAQKTAAELIKPMLVELEAILLGISLIGELSSGTLALVVSYGERMSSVIVSQMLNGAEHLDSTKIFKTIPYFDRSILDYPTTISNIKKHMAHPSSKCSDHTIVIGGFISSDLKSGRITNLGRGGSDFTASVVASTLGARLLEIYTDVDGFMTADPRIAPKAKLLHTLGFIQAMELCNFGAKVLYAPTIFPAYNHNIPIRIKNTFNHTCAGTFIDSNSHTSTTALCSKNIAEHSNRIQSAQNVSRISGISSIKNTALISLSSTSNNAPGHRQGVRWIAYRLSKALSRNGISPCFQSISDDDKVLDIGVLESNSEITFDILSREFAQEIAMEYLTIPAARYGLSTVAIVGEYIDESIRTTSLAQIQNESITPIRIAPNSQRSISMIVDSRDLDATIRSIHKLFFEQEHQHIRLIAKNFKGLEQYIHSKNEDLMNSHNIRFVFDSEGGAYSDRSCRNTKSHIDPSFTIEIDNNPRNGTILLNSDNCLSLGVEPRIKRILKNFKTSSDKISCIEALLPAHNTESAMSRIHTLAEWANIKIDPAQLHNACQYCFEHGGMSDDELLQPDYVYDSIESYSWTNRNYIKIKLLDSGHCTLNKFEPNQQEPNKKNCSNNANMQAECYVSINSERFCTYPLHVWLKELNYDTIYNTILELVV